MKKQALALFQIVFSLLCLMVALSFVEPKTVSKAWASADPFMLGLTFVLMPPAILSRAFRWWYILRRNHITQVNVRRTSHEPYSNGSPGEK